METIIAHICLLLLAFVQNVAFSLVSRSRNRNNITYHIVASIASNLVWYLTFRQLVTGNMSLYLLPTYTVGTVAGSVYGVKISMRIERWLGAASDDHLKVQPKPSIPVLSADVYATPEFKQAVRDALRTENIVVGSIDAR